MNRRKLIVAIALIFALTLTLALSACGKKSAGGGTSENSKESESATESTAENAEAEETQELIATKKAEITVKDYGKIVVELYGDVAPVTVENFVGLAESGFYDGITFHRIMDGFMIQGGDPDHNGFGGSENTIFGEFISNGHENNISHVKGTMSMARKGNDKNSASSQFFIMVDDATYLDGDYAAFGRVVEGQDVVDKIASDAKPIDNNGTIPFENQPVIESIVITD